MTDGGLWMRHLPIGLESEDPEQLAHRLKDEIEAAVAFFLPSDRVFRPQELVLTEEGALDAHLVAPLKRELGLPITRVTELQRIHVGGRALRATPTPEQALSMAKAFGLALSGTGLARFRCPVVEGHPERAAARRLPAVAAGVLIASAALIGTGELSRHWADELQAAVPPELQAALLDRVREHAAMREQVAEAEHSAALLLDIARRRPATFQLRRVLGAVGRVAAERDGASLHLDNLWLATSEPGRPGLLSLTVLSDPRFDAALGERLGAALRVDFESVEVRGPEPAPVPEQSRWVVEIALP
jgi:hypothetical protein